MANTEFDNQLYNVEANPYGNMSEEQATNLQTPTATEYPTYRSSAKENTARVFAVLSFITQGLGGLDALFMFAVIFNESANRGEVIVQGLLFILAFFLFVILLALAAIESIIAIIIERLKITKIAFGITLVQCVLAIIFYIYMQ